MPASAADTTAPVVNILDHARPWKLANAGSADVTWKGDRLTMANRVVNSTAMIGWPALVESGSDTIDLAQTPNLYLDIDVQPNVTTSAWNIYFTNSAGKSVDLAVPFSYPAQSQVPVSVKAKVDAAAALKSIADGNTVQLSEVAVYAVTEQYTAVNFNHIYFGADTNMAGDDTKYGPVPQRPASTMHLTQPTPVDDGFDPNKAYQINVRDNAALQGKVDFTYKAKTPG